MIKIYKKANIHVKITGLNNVNSNKGTSGIQPIIY